jgi:hypothetical protein
MIQYNASEQTISWLRTRFREKTLQIRPPYQRKPVWTSKQKCSLIESILLGYPIPEIYIHVETKPDGDETFAIVDGQQRIRTVLQFVGSETDPDEIEHNKFVLDKLPTTSPFLGTSFSDLTDKQKADFFSYKFAVRYLRVNSDLEVRDMFSRLNRYLTPLKPQELRNSVYSGPFAQLANALADEEFWSTNRIVTPAAIRRMGDIEFVSELLIGAMHGPQGGSSKIIDDYYVQYEDFDDAFPGQKGTTRLFHEALDLIGGLFDDLADTRWSNKTDFYSLFVASAALLRNGKLKPESKSKLKSELIKFANAVTERLADERVKVSEDAVGYVRAVEKGANDKARRAARHQVMLKLMRPFFSAISPESGPSSHPTILVHGRAASR